MWTRTRASSDGCGGCVNVLSFLLSHISGGLFRPFLLVLVVFLFSPFSFLNTAGGGGKAESQQTNKK